MQTKIDLTSNVEKRTYPYVGKPKDKDYCVLFTSRQTGVVVHEGRNSPNPFGFYSEMWMENVFDEVNGKLTITF